VENKKRGIYDMKEREVEKMLVDGIRKLGGRAFKWVSPGNDGVPDRIVVLPGLPAIFVELKTITGRLTSLQRVQLKRLKDLGQTVMVLYGEKEVTEFLKECEEVMLHDVQTARLSAILHKQNH
jgi:hypothetical protein